MAPGLTDEVMAKPVMAVQLFVEALALVGTKQVEAWRRAQRAALKRNRRRRGAEAKGRIVRCEDVPLGVELDPEPPAEGCGGPS